MKIVAVKNTVDSTIAYGSEYTLEQKVFTNVTKIEVIETGIKHFAITHQTGDDTEPHTTNLSYDDYNLMVVK